MTAIFLKDSATTKPASAENPQESGYKEEIMNETWLYLKQKIILAENELISKKEYERQLAEQMDELEKDLQVLRQEIATKGYERRVLDLQERPMKHSFDLLSDKLEQAKIAESEQTNMPDIKIVADAVLPDKKIRPMRSLIVAMAMMLGFVGSCGMVFTRAVLLPALA
jgi:LPS O-antigen subunit length determinant protein (WzzB/FepE family)